MGTAAYLHNIKYRENTECYKNGKNFVFVKFSTYEL